MTQSTNLAKSLRQMIAVLQAERQALAGLDLDGVLGCAQDKLALCGTLDTSATSAPVDDECRALLEAARRLNEVNRQIRNLIAANVSARLDALTGTPKVYRAAGYAMVRG